MSCSPPRRKSFGCLTLVGEAPGTWQVSEPGWSTGAFPPRLAPGGSQRSLFPLFLAPLPHQRLLHPSLWEAASWLSLVNFKQNSPGLFRLPIYLNNPIGIFFPPFFPLKVNITGERPRQRGRCGCAVLFKPADTREAKFFYNIFPPTPLK